MHELLRYAAVIYDANCIVYFCFRIRENDSRGHPVVLSGPNTERARVITARLQFNNKRVTTIRAAFDEANRVLATQALQSLIDEGYVQSQLRIPQIVSPALKLRIAKNLKKEIDSLSKQPWFFVIPFIPAPERVGAVSELYRQFCLNPAYQQRIPPYKGVPSDTDIALILFSGHQTHPLLTNDREVYNFAVELKAHGFCELIRAFNSVRLN
jgi:hypothetical protein